MRVTSKIHKFFLAPPRRSPVQTIFYGEDHAFVCRTSRDHRDDDSARLRRYGRYRAGAQCAKPTLTPSDASNAITSITVKIATATQGAYLRYTLDGSIPTGGSSGNGTQIPATRGEITVTFGLGPKGTTLKAVAYKDGLADSPVAVGSYVYQSPY